MKMLSSIFTDDMNACIVSGMTTNIERHHCLGGFNRSKSEKYNFIAPLHASVHPNGVRNESKNWVELDHFLKRMCQKYFETCVGSREEWYAEFGKFYDDRDNENTWLTSKEAEFVERWKNEVHDK